MNVTDMGGGNVIRNYVRAVAHRLVSSVFFNSRYSLPLSPFQLFQLLYFSSRDIDRSHLTSDLQIETKQRKRFAYAESGRSCVRRFCIR